MEPPPSNLARKCTSNSKTLEFEITAIENGRLNRDLRILVSCCCIAAICQGCCVAGSCAVALVCWLLSWPSRHLALLPAAWLQHQAAWCSAQPYCRTRHLCRQCASSTCSSCAIGLDSSPLPPPTRGPCTWPAAGAKACATVEKAADALAAAVSKGWVCCCQAAAVEEQSFSIATRGQEGKWPGSSKSCSQQVGLGPSLTDTHALQHSSSHSLLPACNAAVPFNQTLPLPPPRPPLSPAALTLLS